MVDAVMTALNVRPAGVYMDATCGSGGHVAAILAELGPTGRVLALDRDPQAVARAQMRFAGDGRVVVKRGSFSTLSAQVQAEGLSGRLSGVLFDLGLSSVQLDDPARGFSFRHQGPLDMRMDPNTGESAARWLAHASEREIAKVLRELGEERYAGRIARAVVGERVRHPITTTDGLTRLVEATVPTRERRKHPATRTFLALRLFINRELEELRAALPQALDALAPEGRLVVISFHSLEDRLVKHFMREHAGRRVRTSHGAVEPPSAVELKLIGKTTRPSAGEVRYNPRARSAILRVAERIGPAHA
jgi:16S rRNA (cytosine1402-N4)-methyltransferase